MKGEVEEKKIYAHWEKGAVKVEGDTFPIKALLKDEGFKWNPLEKNWWYGCILKDSIPVIGSFASKLPNDFALVMLDNVTTNEHTINTSGEMCNCGQDTAVCQKCGKIVCATQVGSYQLTSENKVEGNVCDNCVKQYAKGVVAVADADKKIYGKPILKDEQAEEYVKYLINDVGYGVDKKITLIKLVREKFGCGLHEAKHVVEKVISEIDTTVTVHGDFDTKKISAHSRQVATDFQFFGKQKQVPTTVVEHSKLLDNSAESQLLKEMVRIAMEHSANIQITYDKGYAIVRDFGADITMEEEVYDEYEEAVRIATENNLFLAVRANGVRYTFTHGFDGVKVEKAPKIKGTITKFASKPWLVNKIKHSLWEVIPNLPQCDDVFGAVWGINGDMDFVQKVAELYVLYDLKNVSEEKDLKVFMRYQKTLKELHHNILAYLDFASGGELRHYSACYGYKTQYALPLLAFAKRYHDKHAAWAYWKSFRERYPDALKWANNAFGLSWKSAYGGKKWKQATELLLRWYKGELTEMMFVDTAIGIHHNTGPIFNKVWDTSGLNKICDYAHDGDVKNLLAKVSPEIKTLWEKRNGKVAV